MSGARFVRFYPSDWRSGCIGLTPEEQGFYLMVCAHFWETGSRLPNDDASASSRLMLDVRMYRRLRDKLIQKGKLHVADDGIFNPRAERELEAANRASPKGEEKTDLGSARRPDDREHANGRDQMEGRDGSAHTVSASSAVDQTDFSETSRQSLGEVSENYQEKTNEINAPLKSLNLTLTRLNNLVCHSEAAREAGPTDDPNFVKCKRELNGSTERIIDVVRNADGPYGTKLKAAEWVADSIEDYGGAAVLSAFKFLERCVAEGQKIRDPKAFIAKNARRDAENAKASSVTAAEAKKKAAIRSFMTRY